MADDNGIMAAIMAAVDAYLEEEQLAAQAGHAPKAKAWPVSAREEIMQQRRLWQLRRTGRYPSWAAL